MATIRIKVPVFKFVFEVDGENITVESRYISADYVWSVYCEDNNLPPTKTPEYSYTEIGTKPVEIEF